MESRRNPTVCKAIQRYRWQVECLRENALNGGPHMSQTSDWHLLSQLTLEDRRSGKRVSLAFPIEITGLDSSQKLFVERTVTLDVSETGCRFRLKTHLVQGEVVAIRLLTETEATGSAKPPILFEVAWVDHADDEWHAGAKKLQPSDIWHMNFPKKPPRRNS
jgi:hypothetical protein